MPVITLSHLAECPAAQWDALVPAQQPFLSYAFLSALEESGSLGPNSGWHPQHLLWQENGEIRAAIPGYRKHHSYGEYVFDQGWADACQRSGIAYYPKWLGAVPFSPVTGARLLGDESAATHLLQAIPDFLEENGLTGAHINFTDERANRLIAGEAVWQHRQGLQYHWQNRGYRDFQDYLDALTSRKRKQFRKEREQVSSQGIDFIWREGAQVTEAQWDFVYACYSNTYHIRGQSPYLTRAFFSLLAEKMPEAIRVVFAQQNGRDVAMAFSLISGDSFYGRYWGCVTEFDRLHFETCFYQGMEYAIASGLSRFDAGAQGEHKLLRGFEPVITDSWHYLRHPGLRDAVEDFLVEERAGIQRWAEEARLVLPYRHDVC